MILIRRLAVLFTLMLWQGGFTFYSAVVVPVGAEVLGSHRAQGMITRTVTNYLHGAGIVGLAMWCWDAAAERAFWPRVRWGLLALLAVTLGMQFWLHFRLDSHVDLETHSIIDPPQFRVLHQWYLIVSTVQWAAALLLAALTVAAWRKADTAAHAS
jgi:hypothetical protein